MPYKIGGGRKPQLYDQRTGRYGGSLPAEILGKKLQKVKEDHKPAVQMPFCKNAVTPESKFVAYSLNPNNPNNRGKAEAYMRALGYDLTNYKSLIKQIHSAVVHGYAKVYDKETTKFGVKYKFRIKVQGPNRKTKPVIAVYQIDRVSKIPRMITNYVEAKK